VLETLGIKQDKIIDAAAAGDRRVTRVCALNLATSENVIIKAITFLHGDVHKQS
jgi:hypothetical protein